MIDCLSRFIIHFGTNLGATHTCLNGFEMTLLVKRTSESGAFSIIFKLATHRFSN